MKKAVIVILVMAAVVCASAVMAQGPAAGRRAPGIGASCPAMSLVPPQPMLVERAESLNIPAETKDKLKAILTKGVQTLQPLRLKASEASRALREAVLADEFSEAKVKELAASAEKAEQAVIDAEIGVWREIRDLLSADEMKALREAMIGGPGGRRGGNGPNGAGGPGPQPTPPSE